MKYFAIINDEQVGPMELEELVEAGLKPDTYVWCKGMADWTEAKEVADICRFFRRRIFDLMHPQKAPGLPGAVPPPPVPVQPMTDEDYKPMKRREFYQAVGEQIAENSTDPDLDSLQRGEAPAPLSKAVCVLAVLLFFPLGIPAIMTSRKAAALWKAGKGEDSYETMRTARMMAGLAIGLGTVAIATLVQWLLR